MTAQTDASVKETILQEGSGNPHCDEVTQFEVTDQGGVVVEVECGWEPNHEGLTHSCRIENWRGEKGKTIVFAWTHNDG
jgi:hypothetical protein